MQKTIATDLNIPRRQDKAVILVNIIKFAYKSVKNGWALVIPAYLFLKDYVLADWQIISIVSLVIFGLFGFSYLSYRRFFYYFQNDEIIIEEGVLYRSKLSLPFDKVQTINFKQNVLQQVFNVVELQVDSAGSVKKEVTIGAVQKPEAQHIREYIMRRKDELGTDNDVIQSEVISEEKIDERDEQIKTQHDKEDILVHLNPVDLVKIALSQNHIRSAAIFFAFAWNIYDRIKEFSGIDEDEQLQEITGFVGNDWLGKAGFLIIFVILLSLAVSVVIMLVKNFDLKILANKNGLKKVHGLFDKREQSASYSKIQSIYWGDNLLKKIFKLNAFRIFPTSRQSNDAKKNKYIGLPGCYPDQVKNLITRIFGIQENIQYTSHKMHSSYVLRSFLFIGLLPCIVVGMVLYLQFGMKALFILLWLPTIFFFLKRYHQKWKLLLSEDILHVQYGVFSDQHKMVDFIKIQTVNLHQSPYQRRKGLATISFSTAGKNFTFSYLDIKLALQLQNYILFKVESSERNWM